MRVVEGQVAVPTRPSPTTLSSPTALNIGDATPGRVVGFVKRLFKLYLPPELLPVLRALPVGARTPVFLIEGQGRFARYSWFLRVGPRLPIESDYTGLVRLEVSETVGRDEALRLADVVSAALPRFVPSRTRDPARHRTWCRSAPSSSTCDVASAMPASSSAAWPRAWPGSFRMPDPSASASSTVGLVLGSQDATPLEFWVGVGEGGRLQLDDLVVTKTRLDDGDEVTFYGIVDVVRKRFEGSPFDTDAFRVAEGTLPADVSYAAHVQVTRVEPEVFVPPSPGNPVEVVRGEDFRKALYFDRMERSVAIGLTRTGEPIHANLEFLDGTRGAHASISGVSGVATKTSYATFILYSLFHSGALGLDAANAKALIFNVKGEDLLWLDKPNAKLTPEVEAEYARLGLPAGAFRSVAFFAPARKGSDTPMPDTGSRQDGVQPYVWTIREFCRERLLRFVFVDGEDARAQIHLVISRVEHALAMAAREGDQSTASVMVDGVPVASFGRPGGPARRPALDGMMRGAPVATGTQDAFRRRLHAAAERMGHLVSGTRWPATAPSTGARSR